MPGMPNDPLQLWLWVLPALALYAVIVVGSVRAGRRLLGPEMPPRLVRWSLVEIVLAYLVAQFLWRQIIFLVLPNLGPIRELYGEKIAALIRETSKEPEVENAKHRVFLLCVALAFPFELLSVIVLFRLGSDTQPDELGVSRHRIGPNAALGALAFLVITPFALAVLEGAQWLTSQLGAENVNHPLTRLTQAGLPVGEMIVLTLVVMVVAPVMEELVYRGVIQPWLAARAWGGHVAVGVALVIAAYPSDQQTLTRLTEGPTWQDRVGAASPVIFALALLPFYLLCWRYQKTPAATAIFGTSLLFAIVHKFAWPHPVPLFFLALGLGWLAHRTQSLVGPIVLHSLFNGVACAQLWLMRAN